MSEDVAGEAAPPEEFLADGEIVDAAPASEPPTPVDPSAPPRPTPAASGGGLVPEQLTPTQQRLLDELGTTDRPSFDPDLGPTLRAQLESSLATAADAHAAWLEHRRGGDDHDGDGRPDPLFVSKHRISQIHACEQRYLAEAEDTFAWTVPIARGVVAHKAIELSITWRGTPTPLDLVEGAIARLESDPYARVGDFLATLDEPTRAELLAAANDRVAAFLDGFPPLRRAWRPVTESRVRADLCDDRIVLSGKVDLSLGFARGNQAGRVLLDMKTGGPQPAHIDDLRFYALLETLKNGTPPRMLVNYYLDAGQARSEQVTEDMLWATAQRTVDAVGKIVELTTDQREATFRPSHACKWCAKREDCRVGQQFLAELESA